MKARVAVSLITWAILSFELLSSEKVVAQQPIKRELIGVWALVSVETVSKNGSKLPYLEGGDIKGILIFTQKHYSFQITTEFPKLASNDRLQTTPEENKAVAHGVIANWGTYTVGEADKILTLQNERSSFPNQNGAIGKRNITFISTSELRFTVPTTRAGNLQTLIWERVE